MASRVATGSCRTERSAVLCLHSGVPLRQELPMSRSWTPSIVPTGTDQTFYLVINDFGRHGRAFPETDIEQADLETVISDLISGQHNDPVRVVAFNTTERWSVDVSQDVAREI